MAPSLLSVPAMIGIVLALLPAVLEPALPCADRPERLVSVHVKPWADVYVDGVLVERDVKRARIPLTIGEHVVVFRNPAAFEEARTVFVPSTGDVPSLVVELARRPARLSVRSNVADADVEVCGPTRRAHETRRRPIAIPLEESPATVDVRVSRRGWSTVSRRVEVDAGRRTDVDVELTPEE